MLKVIERIGAVLREPDRIKRRPFFARRRAFYDRMWRAAAADVGAEAIAHRNDIFEIRRGGRLTMVRQSDLMLDSALTQFLFADKARTYKMLAARGIPIADHIVIDYRESARAQMYLARKGGPVVVKPAGGTGAGRGVTSRVETADAMTAALALAGRFSNAVLIEPHITGSSFRLTYLNGVFLQAVRRTPPTVVGDGVHSIGALMRIETRNRLEGETRALAPLIADDDCKNTLSQLGMSPQSYLRKGVRLVVKSVVNQNSSYENHIVSAPIHPSILDMAERCVKDWNIGFAGFDILAPTLTEPLAASRGVVGEVNVNPGIHHHLLVSDPSAGDPFGSLLLDRLLSDPRGGVAL